MHRRKHTILKSLVLGFVVAAFAAPAALAEPRGPGNDPEVAAATPAAGADDRALYRGTSPQLDPTIVSSPRFNVVGSTRAVKPTDAAAATPAASPDDRTMYRGTSPQLDPSILGSPDDRTLFRGTSPQLDPSILGSPDDRSIFRGTETPNVVPVNVTVSSPSSGFQWDDAGLGAASILLVVLLMGATAMVVRHQRRRIAAY